MNAAYRVNWEESERHFGIRPDGVTLHKDMETAQKFIDHHWLLFQERYGNTVPDAYSRPDHPRLVEVSAHYAAMVEREGTIWVSHRAHIPDSDLLDKS